MFEKAAFVLVLLEQFSVESENPHDIWRTSHRWNDLIFNSPLSFHADPDLALPSRGTLLLDPFRIESGTLIIEPRPIPDVSRPDVTELLKDIGRYTDDEIEAVTHYTGMISLHDSWAETYGYFEIRARVPGHAGHWPAFWLSNATKGWPPEIDVFEIDFRQQQRPPISSFKATAHFDDIDPDGNPYSNLVEDNSGLVGQRFSQKASEKPRKFGNNDKPRWLIGADIETKHDLSAEFYVYGLEWNAENIIWYFGTSPDSLEEVFRTPTPPDLHSPLYAIANSEIGGLLAGKPTTTEIETDALEIDYIKVYAQQPTSVIEAFGDISGTNGSDELIGSPGDDVFRPMQALDLIHTNGGRDQILISRSDGNLIVTGFGADDIIQFDGFTASPSKIWETALEVGADVWLRDPGQPFEPRTIILKDVAISSLRANQFLAK